MNFVQLMLIIASGMMLTSGATFMLALTKISDSMEIFSCIFIGFIFFTFFMMNVFMLIKTLTQEGK